MPLVPNEDKPEEIAFVVRGRVEGDRLDQYLSHRFPDYSRSYLQKLIKAGKVLVDGSPAKTSAKLRAGQSVSVSLPKLEALHLKSEELPIEILYEDDELAVIDKPAGLVTHPARGHMTGTIVNALLFHFDKLSECEDVYRPGIVHRLDRDTTGVLLVAKSNRAQSSLGQQFENREVEKEYLALTEGEIACRQGSIELPLGMDPRNRERMSIQHGGKNALTNYRVIRTYPGFSLVHVFPKTGRTHQIRIHFKSQGHPLVADHLYGAEPVLTPERMGLGADFPGDPREPLMARQALHAWKISFFHPATGKKISFGAPLPRDLSRTLQIFQQFWPDPRVAEILAR
jgi:23S rRNA pseudouridine1911/1915/1917 synthase